MTSEHLRIRLATVADAHIVASYRVRMFVDTGRLAPDAATAMLEKLPATFEPMLETGEYTGWFIVTSEGSVVAGAGVQMRRLLPRPEVFTEREALIVNVYVAPEYRRQGHARRLMATILDWCNEQGIERIALHPSALGRHLYESLGFVASNELIYYPKQQNDA